MKKIYIGDIKICKNEITDIPKDNDELKDFFKFNLKYRKDLFKKNAILYEIKPGYFIDLEMLNYSLENNIATLILSTNKPKKNQLYIDKFSLKPYSIDNKKLSKTFYELKKRIKN